VILSLNDGNWMKIIHAKSFPKNSLFLGKISADVLMLVIVLLDSDFIGNPLSNETPRGC
jgi:hypothetical protein